MDDNQERTFRLDVLGSFQLSRSHQVLDLQSRKIACLLTYLACTAPVPQPREKLATLLWGSSNEERARHNLRQAVSRLRQLLGPEVILNWGDAIALAPGAVACDAVALIGLTRENTPASIAAAAELYRGSLLESVPVDETAWSDWLGREREWLSERAIDAMVRHGEAELAAGNAANALRFGQRAVGHNMFREDGHRLVLRSLAGTGRTAEAIKHFQDLAAYLKMELDTGPDDETRQLLAGLADKVAPAGPAEPAAAVIGQAADAEASARRPRDAPAGPGAGRSGQAAAAPAAPELDAGQLRLVTALDCGLVGAPRNGRDPEEIGALATAFHKAAEDVAAGFGGCVAPSSFDRVLVVFGYPRADEFDACQAVRAGVALVAAVAGSAVLAGAGMRPRVGIASGPVLASGGAASGGTMQPVVIGEALVRAAALQALAAPGAVVVAHATRLLLGEAFDLRPVDTVGPGAEQPQAWRVRGERDAVGRCDAGRATLAPLVGRQEELDLLARRWDQARQGEGRVVLVSGEPGIGKSRLADHLLRTPGLQGAATLRYYCAPHHGNQPLHPFIGQLTRSADLALAHGPAAKSAKLRALIERNSRDPARDVALLSDLLTLPTDGDHPALAGTPAQKRERLIAAFVEWIEGQAATEPVVIIFEDIQWIDPTSLDLLDRLVAGIADLPVLMIVTMRPDHRPTWIGLPQVTMLHLSRLGSQDSARIVDGHCDGRRLPQPVTDWIVGHADGIPLFVGELTRHVLESELDGEAAVQSALAGPLREPDLPVTLQSALVARLDQLGEARQVAWAAAAIGRSFCHALLAAVLDLEPGALSAALGRMTAAGLIWRRGSPPDATYWFSHALVCDAAYGMMLRDSRRRLHDKIADALIECPAAYPEASEGTIAHHLFEAGRALEAVHHWGEASRAAQRRWANRESAGYLDMAIAALGQLPDSPEAQRLAVDLHFEIKNALTPLGEFDRVFAHLHAARVLIDGLDDRERLCRFQLHMCHALGLGGRSKEAITYGEEARLLAQSLGESRLLVEATLLLGKTCFTITDYRQAEHLFLDVLELLEGPEGGEPIVVLEVPEVTARAYLTKVKAVRGDFDAGILLGEEAIHRAESVAEPYSLCVACWCLADLHLTRGDVAPAVGLLERGLNLSRRHDFPFMVAAHSGSLGYAYALTARAEEGLPLLEQAIGVFDKMNHQLALSLFLGSLGQASVLAGQHERATDLARRALSQAQETGHRSGEAGALHILAEAAARAGHPEQARQYYTRALALAESLGMRPLAARCNHGLGEACRRLAKPGAARDHLAIAAGMYRDMAMTFWLEQTDLARSS